MYNKQPFVTFQNKNPKYLYTKLLLFFRLYIHSFCLRRDI